MQLLYKLKFVEQLLYQVLGFQRERCSLLHIIFIGQCLKFVFPLLEIGE